MIRSIMKNRHREEHLGTPVLQHMLAVDFTAAQARSPGSYTNWETLPHGRLQEAGLTGLPLGLQGQVYATA